MDVEIDRGGQRVRLTMLVERDPLLEFWPNWPFFAAGLVMVILAIVIGIILAIYMVLAAVFESPTIPLLVMVSIPMALVGVAAALFAFRLRCR